MNEYIKFFTEHPVGCLATTENNKPRLRAFQFLFSIDSKLYFCTSKGKEVYNQLRANGYAEFTSVTPDYSKTIRAFGSINFTSDYELKKKVIDENPNIKRIYESPDNPIFELFYMDVLEVNIFTTSEGNKTIRY